MSGISNDLNAPGSLCYRCRHYDWAVLVGGDGAVWADECHAPGERKAGDQVLNCPDFENSWARTSTVSVGG